MTNIKFPILFYDKNTLIFTLLCIINDLINFVILRINQDNYIFPFWGRFISDMFYISIIINYLWLYFLVFICASQ